MWCSVLDENQKYVVFYTEEEEQELYSSEVGRLLFLTYFWYIARLLPWNFKQDYERVMKWE